VKPAGLAETAGCLAAGFRAFFLREDALNRFGSDRDSFLKSFWAPTLAYPLFLMAMLQVDPTVRDLAHVPSFGWFAARTIGYVIAWIYWPVILDFVCDRLGKSQVWIPLVVAGIWIAMTPMLIQITMVFFIDPASPLFGAPWTAIQVWSLVVHTWLLRRYLQIGLPLAAGLVLGDYILSRVLNVLENGIVLSLN